MTDANQRADLYWHISPTDLRFGNSLIALAFSPHSGNLISLRAGPTGRELVAPGAPKQPSALLRVGGAYAKQALVRNSRVYALDDAAEIGHALRFEQARAVEADGAVALEITSVEGDWAITALYRLRPNHATVERSLRVTYHGAGTATLRDVRLCLPCLVLGDLASTWVEAPGYPVVAHVSLATLPEGLWPGLASRALQSADYVQHAVDAPGSVAGLVGLHQPDDQLSLMCWPHSTREFTLMELERQPLGARLVQWLFLADRFTAGHCLESSRQFVRLAHGSWDEAMRAWQPWFAEVGLEIPPERPAWALGAAIYEVHVGRAPFPNDRSYAPYPTMADLTNDVPRIHRLGFEVIQVMPHWPFCGYTVHDYHQIEHQYGDPAELRRMVTLAHDLGLKVILDVVLHGCIDKEIVRWDMAALDPRYHFIFSEWLAAADERSRYRDEHPEWFIQDEQGATARIYTWAFDHADPSFQAFFIGVLQHYLDDLGVDGFRFDAPTWNCIPNWKPGQPDAPSAAYYACHHLLLRARAEIKARHPHALFYTEPSGPLFRHSMDLAYNYDEEWLSGSLLTATSPRGFAGARMHTGELISARAVAEWLHYRCLSLPAGAQTVHHLDSHDTFWWGDLAQFRREAFGLPAAQALFALFALLDGGIMNYVGAEAGNEDFYRRLLRLRQSDPALRYGDCDYLAITADHARVLPLLRTWQAAHAVPLVNLEAEPVETRLQLPIDRLLPGDCHACLVYDLLNDEWVPGPAARRWPRTELANLPLTLPAHGVRILRLFPVGNGGAAG